jgi:hypothetical protein
VTLAEKLNRYEVSVSVSKGEVTLTAESDFELNDDGTAVNPEVQAFLDELDDYTAYLDEHPEGADRGGYVVFVEDGDDTAQYDHGDCSWW